MTKQKLTLENPLSIIDSDMKIVDKIISERLNSRVDLINQVCHYIIVAGGKRIRPALLLLTANTLNVKNPNRYLLATVVEFIHTATLLHDDVVDESTMRRGRASGNVIFGNAASVLVGDFLHTRSFQMMVECQNLRILQIMSNATNVIAEGEVLQLINTHDSSLTVENYLHVIRSKTAKLFESSCQVVAILANSSNKVEQACITYGQAIGTAFQIIDDVLDYDGDIENLGKNLGDDLREGKCTLPLIFAMQRSNKIDKEIIKSAIENGNNNQEKLLKILEIIRYTDSLESSIEEAKKEIERAVTVLALLPKNKYSQAMEDLAKQLLNRKF